jgi:hypothetical protein
VIEQPYIFRTGETLEQVTWFALPPSYVLFDHGQFYAFWLLNDAPPEQVEYTASSSQRIYRERPDLRFDYKDWLQASRVDEETIYRIMTQFFVKTPDRTERELAVISHLRKLGVSPEAIELVFREQAVGDPYREVGSLIGSLSLADQLLVDVFTHADQIITWTDDETFWFNLTSAVRWWYPYRRGQGKRILPEKELRALIKSNPGGYWLGRTFKPYEDIMSPMYGVDVVLARRMGVIKDGNEER